MIIAHFRPPASLSPLRGREHCAFLPEAAPLWCRRGGGTSGASQPHVLIAVNGFLALVALAALLGIWFGKSGAG